MARKSATRHTSEVPATTTETTAPTATAGRRRSRGARAARVGLAGVLVLLTAWVAGGWYYSGEIEAGAFDVPRGVAAATVPPAPAPGARPAREVTYPSDL